MQQFKTASVFTLAASFSLVLCSCSRFAGKPSWKAEVLRETARPIAPGKPGVRPFWNVHSQRFMFAPAFDFREVSGAVRYRFTVEPEGCTPLHFVASTPWSALSPIWNKIPVGFVQATAHGLDANGRVLGTAGRRRFYRAAVFQGLRFAARLPYRQSARLGLAYLFHQPHFQHWLLTGQPDPQYELYCYPSKIVAAVVQSMLLYATLSPEDSADALTIAKRAADYLIEISEPEGTPWAHCPPTYRGEARTAGRYAGQLMLLYPARAALIYLDLFDATHVPRYFQAAVRIAETYVRQQRPDGTWPLKVVARTGEPVGPNLCIPTDPVRLFRRLQTAYGLNQFAEPAERAFRWILQNPVQTFNWEGQFEDVHPRPPYENLSKDPACWTAQLLLDRAAERPENVRLAEELIRFAEDQFVVWDHPMPQEKWHVADWIIPCVLEQYAYYVPIDASAALMIQTFWKAYRATGKPLYRLKAMALANTMTHAQVATTGRFPTYWEHNERGESEGWINCATFDAAVLLQLAETDAAAP